MGSHMKNILKITAAALVASLVLAGCGMAGSKEEKMAPGMAEESTEAGSGTSAAEESGNDDDEVSPKEEPAGDRESMSLTEDEGDIPSNGDSAETEEKKPVTMADLVGETRKGQQGAEELPETILWFNATYAPLTYSNGWNWRLLGGLEPTEENRALSKQLLEYSWSVSDRKSALDTTKSLLQDGHRKKCLDYTKQLEEWGLLELEAEAFVQQIVTKELEDDVGRYAVAYLMHQAGIEPEYMVAWDLCRVNQLYADYYFCGYMTYEEAMDASLANSLNLQELYGSWEEMVEAYLWGYQFWQGEPIGDMVGYDVEYDSPTLERRHYYEMLQELEDGPYTLDWNMELKKSW